MALMRVGRQKFEIFHFYVAELGNEAKWDQDHMITNRKSHVRLRLISTSMTVDDLERPLSTAIFFQLILSLYTFWNFQR